MNEIVRALKLRSQRSKVHVTLHVTFSNTMIKKAWYTKPLLGRGKTEDTNNFKGRSTGPVQVFHASTHAYPQTDRPVVRPAGRQ